MPTRTSSTVAGSTRALVLSATLIVLVVAVIVSLVYASRDEAPAGTAGSGEPGAALGAPVPGALLVRADSHRLGVPAGDRVRFVEFLDFECEACRAAFPTVERLRAEYAGRVDFVARYFPLPGHANAEPAAAAVAVEAAVRQGRFEPMYQTMYETQASWGDQQVSHAATFRGFAERLGLDMATYDRTSPTRGCSSACWATATTAPASGSRAPRRSSSTTDRSTVTGPIRR